MDSIVDTVRLDCVDSVNGKDYNLLDIGDFDVSRRNPVVSFPSLLGEEYEDIRLI